MKECPFKRFCENGMLNLDEPKDIPCYSPVPNGLKQIIEVYGQPGDTSVLVPVSIPPSLKSRLLYQGKFVPIKCHKLCKDSLEKIFSEIAAAGLERYIREYSGCFNNRNKRGQKVKSTHAWGIAIDFNGCSGSVPQNIIDIFERNGWYSGTHFNDPWHFQRAKGY